jgi:hypothetical protein
MLFLLGSGGQFALMLGCSRSKRSSARAPRTGDGGHNSDITPVASTSGKRLPLRKKPKVANTRRLVFPVFFS